jgi:glycosyltransferase involved in cell wall biosynthesis
MKISSKNNSENILLAIVVPVLDEWKSLSLLLPILDRNLNRKDFAVEVIIVDDGSRLSFVEIDFVPGSLENITKISVLELKRNVGHQRAITLGLAFVAAERPECQAVIIMDGDGEDKPEDIIKLIDKCRRENFSKLIFAKRSKRSEGAIFKFFYSLYINFFKILTGQNIRVGNFSIVPRKILRRLVVISDVWNHYAVGSLKARVPYAVIETERGKRLSGSSKMNFVSLVTHGLSAISVYGDTVGVRLLLGTSILILLSLVGVLIVAGVRIFTDLAIPGWATYVSALLLIILMQAVVLSLFFIFLVLNNRNNAGFLPAKDYQYFISEEHEIYPKK